jgi:uncharacterized membrane protein YhaH (DUF805 family)
MKLQHIYFSFTGRLSLKNYWLYWFIPLAIALIALEYFNIEGPKYTWLWRTTNLLIIWPALATTIKRLHDINKSGWWTLIHLIPIIGSLLLTVVLSFVPGTKGKNQYDKHTECKDGI